MKKIKVIISGGGTAGHLYPALSVGQKLKEKAPLLEVIYVGSTRKMEKRIMEKQKSQFIPLKIQGIMGKGWKIFPSLSLLPLAFIKSMMILLRIQPHLVIGAGGYSSGPVVLLASSLNIPTLIMEQNLRPGFTNRFLLPWVDKAVVAFKNSLPYFKGKGVFLGNPVREEFHNISPKKHTPPFILLIFGGSQGSHFLNKGITEALPLLKKEDMVIFHQTGEKDCQWVQKKYQQHRIKATISPYFSPMADYFQKSDLIISRAGATTIAEIIAAQKASVLVPFSEATDNHQLLNARELEKIEGAEIIQEEEFTPQLAAGKIRSFINNKHKLRKMENNLKQLNKRGKAAEQISQLCFHLMNKKKKNRSKSIG
ncbi:undecaprenyldiphospho-muramoylpentapeptide beta-N-acetylglucosaminyltransferase [bacterium]|nr:undecaprenyldiphospho-muramoylpentapeptide beta-N-acetylglucosaminyltransferase [bacterium]